MDFRTRALSLLARVQAGLSHTELVHLPHPLWPLPDRHSSTSSTPVTKPLRISILDASFNPPTLAHLALINASIPALPDANSRTRALEGEDYDARLLLLSVKNADKTLKSTDATYIQRLEMMRLLATHIHPLSAKENANVAIGITNEPTFVGKSTSFLSFLWNHLGSVFTSNPRFELSFIIGMDTLERLVAPRYYASEEAMVASLNQFLSPEKDNSVIVCARRDTQSSTSPSVPSISTSDGMSSTFAVKDDTLKFAQAFLENGRIKLINISAEESTYSSTTVRNTIQQLGDDEGARAVWGKLVALRVGDYISQQRLYLE